MERTMHIRLSGHAEAFPLDHAAHHRLLRYLEEARAALHSDPDGDETVRDLEMAIGEQLLALPRERSTSVNEEAMTRILSKVGRVVGQHPRRASDWRPPRGPFWCRIQEGKWFGGICLGIAERGDFKVEWVRTIVFFLLFFSAGLVGFGYLLLLLILPVVPTVDDYRLLRDTPPSQP